MQYANGYTLIANRKEDEADVQPVAVALICNVHTHIHKYKSLGQRHYEMKEACREGLSTFRKVWKCVVFHKNAAEEYRNNS